MPALKDQLNHRHPLVVPFDFDGEGQLAIHRDFWHLPISISAKSFYLVMLSQEDKNRTYSVEECCKLSRDLTPQIVRDCMAELRSVDLDPHNVRGWEHV